MSAVIGVDGGSRRTYALVADEEGALLGAADGGPSNWERQGDDGTRAAVGSAIERAMAKAGVEPGDVAATVLGMAGIDWPSDAPRMNELVDPIVPPGPRGIVNDAFLVLRAGTSESWGIAVISGTGTVAVGRDPVGAEFRTIGEGRVFGDFGDEFDVSDLAVEAVANAHTGRGPATLLTDMLCERLGESNPEMLLERLARQDPQGRSPELQNLTPMVLAAAEGGDLVARDVLERIGRALGESAGLVARRLNLSNLPVEVVLAGGLFRTPNRYLLDELELNVRRTAPRAEMRPLQCPPVVGAVLLALEKARIPTTGNAAARLRAEATAEFWGPST